MFPKLQQAVSGIKEAVRAIKHHVNAEIGAARQVDSEREQKAAAKKHLEMVTKQLQIVQKENAIMSTMSPLERAQWATDGPVVVSTSGEVLGTLSTVESNTNSLFNESIYVQVPYMDRCEACIGSLNDNFSTEGPKIYDSQSSELKDKIGELIGAPLQEEP